MDDLQTANRYAAGGHKHVEGWLATSAAKTIVTLAVHQQRLGITGGACEIGVYHGKLFILLCLLLRAPERALAVDLYERQAESDEVYGPNLREQLSANLKRHRIDLERVELLAENSMQLTAARVQQSVGAVRLFSVDGGHSAQVTENDLNIAAASTCEGALVILDDFFNCAWPEVAEGTCRFMSKQDRLVPAAIVGNRFIFAHGNAEPYQRALTGERTTAFGRPVVVVPEPTLRARLMSTPMWESIRHRPIGTWARRALQWMR